MDGAFYLFCVEAAVVLSGCWWEGVVHIFVVRFEILFPLNFLSGFEYTIDQTADAMKLALQLLALLYH